MAALHKDILQLVFLELDHGHDMLNFSELNRKSNQIFQQRIRIIYKPATNYFIKYMENNHHQKHGINRGWYEIGKLYYEHNYMHGQKHGINRMWYATGKLDYADNYHQGQLHGICRGWNSDGKLMYEDNYHHGTQIEK